MTYAIPESTTEEIQMNKPAEESPDPSQEQTKPVMNANQIIEAMAKLFAVLETKYTINEANMRGALHTMLHQMDK